MYQSVPGYTMTKNTGLVYSLSTLSRRKGAGASRAESTVGVVTTLGPGQGLLAELRRLFL